MPSNANKAPSSSRGGCETHLAHQQVFAKPVPGLRRGNGAVLFTRTFQAPKSIFDRNMKEAN